MTKLLALKSLATSAVLCGLLAGVASSSLALTWTIDVNPSPIGGRPANEYTWTDGVDSVGLVYTSVLVPFGPADYVTPSGVSWGTLITAGFGGPDSMPLGPDTANFNFDIYRAGLTPADGHNFTAFGNYTQTAVPGLQTGQSSTRWNLNRIVDNTTALVYTAGGNFSLDPITNAPSILFTPNIFDGPGNTGNLVNVNVWMENVRQLPIPGGIQTSVLNGFIADVPEPGSVALLIGAGISGLVLRRRRRA